MSILTSIRNFRFQKQDKTPTVPRGNGGGISVQSSQVLRPSDQLAKMLRSKVIK